MQERHEKGIDFGRIRDVRSHPVSLSVRRFKARCLCYGPLFEGPEITWILVSKITRPIFDNPKLLEIPVGKDDRYGAFLEYINRHNGTFELDAYHKCLNLYTTMPFLIAYDDRDFIERLLRDGCSYCLTDAATVHLYHPRAEGYYEGDGPSEWILTKFCSFLELVK